MINFIKIAWRNLSRNKMRSCISILAIAVVVMIVIFSRGLIEGFSDSSYEQYINNYMGHVKILNEEYRHREALMTLEYTIDGFEGEGLQRMLAEINELEEVNYVLPRLQFGALFGSGDELVHMVGVGIDPIAEKNGVLPEDVTRGRMPEAGNEILVGKGLLADLDVEVGERVTLMFSNALQSLQARTFEVVGMRESGTAALDDTLFFLPLETAQNILHLEDQATGIMVFAENRNQANKLEESLTELLAEKDTEEKYLALHWARADAFLELFKELEVLWDFVYAGFILLGSIVVISSLTMIIRDRKSEIGMMSALGLKGRDIMKIFTLEGFFMGLIGSATGVIGGGFLNHYLAREGIHVEEYAQLIEGSDFLIDSAFYPVFNIENLVVSFLFGVVIVTLSCLYPARKAAKMEPVEALHDEN